MTKPEQFNESLHKVQSDIRLEVILTDLIAEGLSMEDVVLINNSLFKRNYHYDIESSGETEYGASGKKKLCIVVNRSGIYDQLPEDLFHQAEDIRQDINKEETIREMKVQHGIEKQSRIFFLPFEHEFYRQRVKLEAEERRFLFETNSTLTGEIFDYLWDLPEFLNDSQKSKLGSLIPVLHKITGNTKLIAFIIENITGDPIEIRESAPARFLITDEPLLGEMQLSMDSILGGEVSGLQPAYTLVISVTEPEKLTDYMPGGKRITVHEFLCNLLMPLDTDIVFETEISKSSASFILESGTSHLGRLNYTTII